jgi:sugar/nucleoside kinase (ribokinase family)
MPQKYDVAGLGNAIMDVIAAVDDDFLLKHGIAKGAMTLIDEFRAQELHKALGHNVQEAGGSAANTWARCATIPWARASPKA